MTRLRPAAIPPLGLDVTGLALATIGLMLCFMPVLGIPIAGLALIAAIVGLGLAWLRPGASLRLPLAAVALATIALGMNLAIYGAPARYVHRQAIPNIRADVPARPNVPPPARPSSDLAAQRVGEPYRR